ncbi:hypothetical protein [Streptomyces sp. NPDC048172]|uniref:hypothetical protein n=1 Tax=Streptomyces sp. NPDC048172 TaxID=3365505 RepID=UPI003723BE6B
MMNWPRHYSIMVVDIEKFGTRRDPEQALLRHRMYTSVSAALSRTGIAEKRIKGTEDRGDGLFYLFSPKVPKIDLTGPFVQYLHEQISVQSALPEGAPLRIRVALHAGEVFKDSRSWVGTDLNTACRLVDLDALRETLAATDANSAGLALAVSQSWYDSVVRQDWPGVERETFRQTDFHSKEVRETAWLRVPGYSTPPGLKLKGPGGAKVLEEKPYGEPAPVLAPQQEKRALYRRPGPIAGVALAAVALGGIALPFGSGPDRSGPEPEPDSTVSPSTRPAPPGTPAPDPSDSTSSKPPKPAKSGSEKPGTPPPSSPSDPSERRPERPSPSPASTADLTVLDGRKDSFAACPHGRACFFEGRDGTGSMGFAPGCGWIDLGPLRAMVSSVKTHGNNVTLYDSEDKVVASVQGWSETVLPPDQEDRPEKAFVHCLRTE